MEETKGKRYTVLTYIFNGYEKVHEVGEKDPDAEYLLITDDPNLKSETWTVVVDDARARLSPFARCYEVRFHPFRYAHTPIVVRVDGSIEVKKALTEVVDAFERGRFDRCLMIHPHRNTMREEYDVWVRTRGYPRSQAERCLLMMERMGYDLSYQGLYQGCFEVLRDNQVNKDVNDLTFGLLCLLASNGRIERLDQTITSFVLNRFFEGRIKVMTVGEEIITDGGLMQWYLHDSDFPIPMKEVITPVLFNKAVGGGKNAAEVHGTLC